MFTDGKATDARKLPAAQRAWRSYGASVFAVGIGNGINKKSKYLSREELKIPVYLKHIQSSSLFIITIGPPVQYLSVQSVGSSSELLILIH